jgi:hypothetical protein
MANLNWLHLSDLHVGMQAQGWLWPRFEKEFIEDLSRIHDKAGPWHLILFTGDLVRAGDAKEFKLFDEIIEGLFSHLRRLGSDPSLVTLPGNHDLLRPSKLDAKAIALSQIATNVEMQQDFWGKDEAGYRQFVNERFQNYSDWRTSAIARGLHAAPAREGLLVGDASYAIDGSGATARMVTLNATWAQLGEGDYSGRLMVHPTQLVNAVDGRPDEWLRAADLAIVATHQPFDWLDQPSQEQWRSEIYTADRFSLHAFGHMHEPDTRTFSHGGGGMRREFQAASLFGLERIGNKIERIQGYSANRLAVSDDQTSVRILPRRLVPVADGEKKLKPDATQDLDEDNSYTLPIRQRAAATTRLPDAPLLDSPQSRNADEKRFKIENIELILPRDPAHEAVRRDEQDKALEAWNDKGRCFWLVSDWGFAEEAFVGSIKARLEAPDVRCFRLGLEKFSTRAHFLETVRVAHGVTFEEICDRIDKEEGALLILDDAPLQSPPTARCHAVAAEIERLIYATRDYLAHGRFVVMTRTAPASPSLPCIELKPLDEPDIRAYVTAKRGLDATFAAASTIDRLLQVTDGHPGRLDAALKQLEVVSLNELVMANSDLEPSQAGGDIPVALPAMINGLLIEGASGERAHQLLHSLALFPRGEQLERIRRFDNSKPFFPQHATMLLDRHLIDAVTYSHMGHNEDANTKRLLVVPRPVREYLRLSLTPEKSEQLDRRAMELYFGDSWKKGLAAGTVAARIAEDPLAPPHDLLNCNTILLRTLVRAKEAGNEVDTEAAIRAATSFLSRQMSGSHYRNALALTEDLLPLLREIDGTSASYVEISRARCLRMTGRSTEARDAYIKVDTTGLSKKERQEIKLGLALAYSSHTHREEKKLAAEEAVALSLKSVSALHGRVILAELESKGSVRDAKLERLAQQAKARKAHVLENNIRISRAIAGPPDERRLTLRAVIDSSRTSGDYYNKFRASVSLFEDREPGSPVSDADKMTLITAYHFFHNERIDSYFSRVHAILWKVFEDEGDIRNLLSLFRHSSFIWRLSEGAATESEYLEALRLRHDSIVHSNVPNVQRERTYFLVRLRARTEG